MWPDPNRESVLMIADNNIFASVVHSVTSFVPRHTSHDAQFSFGKSSPKWSSSIFRRQTVDDANATTFDRAKRARARSCSSSIESMKNRTFGMSPWENSMMHLASAPSLPARPVSW